MHYVNCNYIIFHVLYNHSNEITNYRRILKHET
nr:MAG TPA: hypothetical protein [Caudoviricetes sp.]